MFQRLLSMFQRAVINLLEDMEYNANKVVAAIIPSDGSDEHSNHRDIVLHLNGGGLRQISPSNSSLHYVLLFFLFIHGLECNQHYFCCFNNLWLMLGLLLNRAT